IGGTVLAWVRTDQRPPAWDYANHLERMVACADDLAAGRLRAILERSSFYPPLVPCTASLVYRLMPSDAAAAQVTILLFLGLGGRRRGGRAPDEAAVRRLRASAGADAGVAGTPAPAAGPPPRGSRGRARPLPAVVRAPRLRAPGADPEPLVPTGGRAGVAARVDPGRVPGVSAELREP